MSLDVMDWVGVLLVLSHIVVIGAIVLWFMAGKPTSAERLRSGMRTELRRNVRLLFSLRHEDDGPRR